MVNLSSAVAYAAPNYAQLKGWEEWQGKAGEGRAGEGLQFESRFECGNLAVALRSSSDPSHYGLYLHNDTNTLGYNRWFYFAITNHAEAHCRLSILNFRKDLPFLRQGMRPVAFSRRRHQATGHGWTHCGRNIKLTKTLNDTQHHTLSFELDFEHHDDLVLVALLPPYSYSRLTRFLLDAQTTSTARPDLAVALTTVAHSLTSTQVPYLTVSAKNPSKRNIIVLARQHPGEVWSSFLAEAIVRELLREGPEKEWLLERFTFRIFPMINVDGVIYGNFRCDLAGLDLNRHWQNPSNLLQPQLVSIREEVVRLSTE